MKAFHMNSKAPLYVQTLFTALTLLAFSQVSHAQSTPATAPAAAPAPAAASDPAKEALAKKIIDSSDFDKVGERMKFSLLGQVEGMFAQQTGQVMSNALDALLQSKKLSAEKHKKAAAEMPKMAEGYFKQEVPKVLDSMKKALDGVNLKTAIYEGAVPFYVANFSQDELEKLLAFQSSPLGQKVLNNTPKLIEAMFPVIQKRLNAAVEPQLKTASSGNGMEAYLLKTIK
jgi:hypothetical protein